MSNTTISCPQCGSEIDVNNVLSHQLEEEYKRKYNSDIAAEKKKYVEQAEELEKQKALLQEKEKNREEEVAKIVAAKLTQEKQQLQKDVEARINKENSDRFADLEKELNEKSDQVKELNKAKAEIERIKREKNELKDSLEAESEIKFTAQITEEREKIRKQEHEKNELKFKELQKQLDDQKKLTDEMARKQGQGSMQLQGEIQELGIEQWLSQQFPLDVITEIKKGERGADCIQTVNTRSKPACGTIYYESKRTKDFGGSWIEKFKNDIRDRGANIGVLVTEAYPKGMERLGLMDGIWVCSYEEFKGLCHVLRESLVQLSEAVSSQENKGEKMVMLYDFLISLEFKLQVEAIVEGFTQMQGDLVAEKRSMEAHWKKREKHIEKVIKNTTHMYGSIKGIAGSAVQSIKLLELAPQINEEAIETDMSAIEI